MLTAAQPVYNETTYKSKKLLKVEIIMRKITNENIKELATDLLKVAGTDDQKSAKIYYKNGMVKLTTTPISDTLWVNDRLLKDLFKRANEAKEERTVGEFRKYMEDFAKTYYEESLIKDLEKVQTVYQKVLSTRKDFSSANHARSKLTSHPFLLPITKEQKKAFRVFKKGLEAIDGVIVPVDPSVEGGACIATIKSDVKDVEGLIAMRRLMLLTPLDKLINRLNKKDIDATEEILEFGKNYDRFLEAFHGMESKAEQLAALVEAYEKSSVYGENHTVIKELADLGYKVNTLMVYKSKIEDVNLSLIDLHMPEITFSDGELKIQTISVGEVTVEELDETLAMYEKAKQAIALLKGLVSFYYIAK